MAHVNLVNLNRRAKRLEIPTLDEFEEKCNGRARARIFYTADYETFVGAVKTARRKSKRNEPYYVTSHAGGVAKSYFKKAFGGVQTAQWGVWSVPRDAIVVLGLCKTLYRRTAIYPANGLPGSAWDGGKPAYMKWFREWTDRNLVDPLLETL